MFATGWAAPRRRSACRTADILALKSHNLDATIFWFRAPNFGDPAPAASPILRVIVAHRTDAASLKIGLARLLCMGLFFKNPMIPLPHFGKRLGDALTSHGLLVAPARPTLPDPPF